MREESKIRFKEVRENVLKIIGFQMMNQFKQMLMIKVKAMVKERLLRMME